MITRDLLLRGRGAEIGIVASTRMVRACGAVVGVAIYWLGDALGLWPIVGAAAWIAQLLCAIGGALIAPSSIGAVLWLVSGLLTTLLMLVMYTPLVRGFAPAFIRADVPSTASVDAVVVLSGGLTDDGLITAQALDRLLSAIAVAKRRGIHELALSIVEQKERPPLVTSEADQRALVRMMAPELTLRFVRDVHATRDEALQFSALARTHQWQRVIVVTSPLHTRRACSALEVAGLHVECIPADGRDYALSGLNRAGPRRLAFQDALYETFGTMLYRARGWMR